MQWMLMEIIKLIVLGESMLHISFPIYYALSEAAFSPSFYGSFNIFTWDP